MNPAAAGQATPSTATACCGKMFTMITVVFMSVWGIVGIVHYTHMKSSKDQWFAWSMLAIVIWSFLWALSCYIFIVLASFFLCIGGMFYQAMPEHNQEVNVGDADSGETVNLQRDAIMKKAFEWVLNEFLGKKQPGQQIPGGLANAIGNLIEPKSPMKPRPIKEDGEVDEERRALKGDELVGVEGLVKNSGAGDDGVMGRLFTAVKKELKTG